MSLDARLLASLEACLADAHTPLFLGLSGGMDSMLLLEACARLQLPVTALHVHHGLQAAAAAWAEFCQAQCQRRGLAFVCERVELAAGGNIEARAREARYAAFAKHARGGNLLLAQHQDDQAETLLLRLMRGAGAQGLSSMAARRNQGDMTLVRPLLGFSRAELERLAQHWQLEWVNDPSNQNPRFSRNWVRHQLLPEWQAQQPDIKQQLARSAMHLAEAAQLLDELAAQDLAAVADEKPGLSLAALTQLSPSRRDNLLRFWLASKEPFRPGEEVLGRVQQQVIDAAPDRQPQLWLEKGVLTRYRQRLYWLPQAVFAPLPDACLWQLEQPLQLGALHLQRLPYATAAGAAAPTPQEEDAASRSRKGLPALAASMRNVKAMSGTLLLPAGVSELRVGFAQGGERLLRHGQHQQVSELWRAAAIPPWVRRWLPLFYVDNELVAAAAIGVADNWQAVGAGKTIGWKFADWFEAG